MERFVDNKIIVSFPKGKYRNKDAVENVISYVLRLGGRKNLEQDEYYKYNLYGFLGCIHHTKDGAIRDFYKLKRIYKKEDGLQIKHMIISFPVGVERRLSKKEIKMLINKTISLFSLKYQLVWACHEDTDNFHIHLAINSVCIDGLKFSMNNNDKKRLDKKLSRIWKKVLT